MHLSPKLHDAELFSVQIDRIEKKIVLGFTRMNEVTYVILSDAISFRINDLIFQNVVSRLIVSTESPMEDTEIIQWLKWVHSLNETQPVVASEAIEEYLKQIKSRELILLVIEPSWGAEGVVICKSIDIREG